VTNLAFLTIILFFLAMPPLSLWPIGFFCLVPLFYAVLRSNFKKAFLIGLSVGLIQYALLFYWLVLYKISVFLLILGLFSLFLGLVSLTLSLLRKFIPSKREIWLIFLVPSLWLLLGKLFSLIPLGIGTFWLELGYSQVRNLNLLQITSIIGISGLTYLLLFINTLIYLIIAHRPRVKSLEYKILLGSVLGLITLGIWGNFVRSSRISAPSQEVALIQGMWPQSWEWRKAHWPEILKSYLSLTARACFLKKGISLVAWPEYALPVDVLKEQAVLAEVSKLAQRLKVKIIFGAFAHQEGKMFNIVMVCNERGDFLTKTPQPLRLNTSPNILKAFHQKLIPVPFGEAQITRGGDFRPFMMDKNKKLGVSICYEDTFPEIIRRLARDVDYFLILANDARFKKTLCPFQHAVMTRVRAVENSLSIARVANTGFSFIATPYGELKEMRVIEFDQFGDYEVERNTLFTRQVLIGKLYQRTSRSFYSKHGDFSLILSILVLALFTTFMAKRKNFA
jgi:apolipoprotein N-acyltransferase